MSTSINLYMESTTKERPGNNINTAVLTKCPSSVISGIQSQLKKEKSDTTTRKATTATTIDGNDNASPTKYVFPKVRTIDLPGVEERIGVTSRHR